MRTTVDVDEDLLVQARRIGLDGGRSLSKVVEDALRVYVNARSSTRDRDPVRLSVFDGPPGLLPGVDLEDAAALADLLDQPDEDPGAAR